MLYSIVNPDIAQRIPLNIVPPQFNPTDYRDNLVLARWRRPSPVVVTGGPPKTPRATQRMWAHGRP